MLNHVMRKATASAVLGLSGVASAGTLTIEIEGIVSGQGNVLIALLDSEDAFENDGEPVRQWRIAAPENGPVTVQAPELSSGRFGVKAMQDLNSNGKLDTNLVGLPKEPYAFSNNARGRFGPPAWADVVFNHDGDTSIRIELAG